MSLVLTAPCRLVSQDLSCESSLGQLSSYEDLPYRTDPSHLANETSPWDLPSRLLSTTTISAPGFDIDKLPELQRDADLEGKELVIQKKKVYIYCAPCLCQIWTAFRICQGAQGLAKVYFQFCVRVDARLTATSCQISSTTAGLAAIVEQIRSIEMDGNHLHFLGRGKNIAYIDRDWIDQRLYDQEDEMFQISAVGEARSLSFIFDRLPSEKLAAVIILGERDHLVPMLRYLPFQRLGRPPREDQFFQVKRERNGNEWSWYLKYRGSFTAKKSQPAQTTNSNSSHPQGQQYLSETSVADAAPNSRSREAYPSTNTSGKRQRTITSSDG